MFSLLMAWPSMIPFTVGALGCAALLGLGNGAVFKLVPERFPRDTGTVTGLVGALGGLGGFFPPLLLGVFRDRARRAVARLLLLSLTAVLLCASPTSASSIPPTCRGAPACRRRRGSPSIASAPAPGRPA